MLDVLHEKRGGYKDGRCKEELVTALCGIGCRYLFSKGVKRTSG